MAGYQVVLIPGDGIGPEVVAAARRVVEASGVAIDWIECQAGAGVARESQVASCKS